jgi:hypothetical protein
MGDDRCFVIGASAGPRGPATAGGALIPGLDGPRLALVIGPDSRPR